ncbi:MAG TPA: acyltransferase [Acidimicrobiia bacterium]|nr:acyltransferase [Acidimicrobiia bacterium]
MATPAGERLAGADGLRALAALMVVVFHTAAVVGPLWLTGSLRRSVWQLGPFGVAVFFVLSGFLMYRPYVAASFDGRPAPPLVPYAVRRVARIIPGFWFALLGAFVLVNDSFQKAAVLPLQALLVQNYRFGYALTGLGVAWTLVIECAFYVVLPGIGFIALRMCRRAQTDRRRVTAHLAVVATLILIALSWRAYFSWGFDARAAGTEHGTWFSLDSAFLWLPAYLDLFACGMLLAVAANAAARTDGRFRVVRTVGARPAAALLAAGCSYALLTPLHLGGVGNARSIASHAFGAAILRAIAATLLLLPVAVAASPPSRYRTWLASPTMVWLGTISYGIYLWHLTMLDRTEEIFGSVHDRPGMALVFLTVALGATLLIAVASWRYVERPVAAFASERLALQVPQVSPPAGDTLPLGADQTKDDL